MPQPYQNPLTRQQRRESADSQRLAGLQLREQAMETQVAQANAKQEVSEAGLALKNAQFQRDQALDQFELGLKMEARKQSIQFLKGLATLSEQDPDFESHAAALQSAFPYATMDQDAQKFFELKSGAHQRVRDSVAKAAQETGINPWDPAYVVRDGETGRFKGVDWGRHGTAVGAKRKALVAEALAGQPLGGKVVSEVAPGTTVTTERPTAAAIINDANVPVATIPTTVPEAVAAVNAGRAQVQVDKNAAADARNKQATYATRLRALSEKVKAFDPKATAEFDALIKEMETPQPAAPAAPAVAPPATKDDLRSRLRAPLQK